MLLTSLALATCFELVGPKYYFLPKELCFTGMTMNVEQSVLYIDSDTLPETMSAELVRHNEDYYNFKASKTIIDVVEGSCSDATTAVLNLKGKIDNYGSIDTLEMLIDYEHTNDNCHSSPRPGKAVYQLKQ